MVPIKELASKLKEPAKRKRPILIKADRRASMGRIVDVWDLCRKIGIERINIATNKD
ncbi:MAG: biopolymer transporter ExbD [Candidatus Omnitrophica bacterium]|nr:biopolymer transporter ExbD [Candidatus Omnitrophota bacterium]